MIYHHYFFGDSSMKDEIILLIVGVICITTIIAIALSLGYDSSLPGVGIGGITGLVAYAFGKKRGESRK